MPDDLVKHIKGLTPSARRQVWIHCNGKPETSCGNVTDIGNISYNGGYGFPDYYYPYQNTERYLNPLVAVQFLNPPGTFKLF